jgi:hypothetical protein
MSTSWTEIERLVGPCQQLQGDDVRFFNFWFAMDRLEDKHITDPECTIFRSMRVKF